MKYTKLDYLNDYMLVSSFYFEKNAQVALTEDLKTTLEKLILDKIDKTNLTQSTINFLSPAIIYQILSTLTGKKWIGVAIGLLITVFKVDVYGILGKICNELKQLISSGTKITEEKVTQIVDSHISQIKKEGMHKVAFDFSKEQQTALSEFAKTLTGGSSRYGIFSKLISIFGGLLRFFFITSLTATGFLVAGNAIRSMLPSSTTQTNLVPTTEEKIDLPKSKKPEQIKDKEESSIGNFFKKKKEWVIGKPNTKNNIENFVVSCVQENYPSLSRDKITKAKSFNVVVEHIEDYNYSIPGWNMFFIPSNFKSEKDIADIIKKDINI